MHDAATVLCEALEAGARGFLLKSDAKWFLVAAVESLAAHKPFFTSKVLEELLESYLAGRRTWLVTSPPGRRVAPYPLGSDGVCWCMWSRRCS
jgi:DNA-binding NarL/FixJ family response regulator